MVESMSNHGRNVVNSCAESRMNREVLASNITSDAYDFYEDDFDYSDWKAWRDGETPDSTRPTEEDSSPIRQEVDDGIPETLQEREDARRALGKVGSQRVRERGLYEDLTIRDKSRSKAQSRVIGGMPGTRRHL